MKMILRAAILTASFFYGCETVGKVAENVGARATANLRDGLIGLGKEVANVDPLILRTMYEENKDLRAAYDAIFRKFSEANVGVVSINVTNSDLVLRVGNHSGSPVRIDAYVDRPDNAVLTRIPVDSFTVTAQTVVDWAGYPDFFGFCDGIPHFDGQGGENDRLNEIAKNCSAHLGNAAHAIAAGVNNVVVGREDGIRIKDHVLQVSLERWGLHVLTIKGESSSGAWKTTVSLVGKSRSGEDVKFLKSATISNDDPEVRFIFNVEIDGGPTRER